MKPLIPHFIQERVLERQWHGIITGYVMYVDLSGFTPLTETLMAKGSQGAEELSHILNDIFQPLVHVVYARGGIIPHFAGDAFTAVFPDQDPESGYCFVDAAASIVEFFEQRNYLFGGFRIGLKIGLSYGEVEWGIAGHNHLAYYFRGAPIDQSAICQEKAKFRNYPIVADKAFQERVENMPVSLLEFEPGYYSLSPPQPSLRSRQRRAEPGEIQREILTSFLPEAVADYQQDGEFRTVVSVFIAFEGVEDRRILHRFINQMVDHVNSFSGYLKEIDFGDKGSVLVCFFGVPVSYENNDNRALEFVYSIRQELEPFMQDHPLRYKAGATMGLAYTGIVGGKERCQYAMVGNMVNLAARLMASADWGEILVDGEMRKNRHFLFEHHGDIRYKGIEGTIPTYRLKGRMEQTAQVYAGQLVGRDKELSHLVRFAQPLYKGAPAGVSCIFGEAGIGKSRLSFEVRQIITGHGSVQWAFCPADQILHKPFNPFVYFLKNHFGQSNNAEDKRNLDAFEGRFKALVERLGQKPGITAKGLRDELVRTKSVLAALVGLVYLDSLWEQLDAKGRYENTIQAIVNLFCCEAELNPLVIELEDAHWLDDNSAELLAELLRQAGRFPILILITSRFNDDGSAPAFFEVVRGKAAANLPFLEVDLNALQSNYVREFAENKLQGKVSQEFLDILLRSSNSNPFYIEQLLEYFAEQKMLVREGQTWTVRDPNIQLSNSINAILIARIDRLSSMVKETVKAAAVIGREFELPVLAEIMSTYDEFARKRNETYSLLHEQVEVAERGQIWRAMNEIRYIFSHSLLREAAYSMQMKARLQQLHRLIAEAIERLYGDRLEDRYFDLAFHYEQAGVLDKTLEFLRKSGDYALGQYQNQQALEYYENFLTLLPEDADPATRVMVLLSKGRILELIGNWEACAATYQEAIALAEKQGDKLLSAQSQNAFGRLLMLQGDYFKAMQHLRNAMDLFEVLHHEEGMIQALGNLGNLYFRQGKYTESEQYFHRSIDMAQNLEDFHLDAQIVANLGLNYMNLGNFDEGIRRQEVYLKRCIARNDKQGMSVILTFLGIVLLEKGDYKAALKSFQQGLDLCNELGNKQLTAIAIGNIGIVYERQGNYKRAMENYLKDLELVEELGDKQGTAIALGLIGQLLNVQGEFHRAIEYLQKDLMLCEELGYQKGIAKAVNTLGDIFYNLQQYARSLHFYNRAIEVTRLIGNRLVLGFSLVEKGAVLLETGDWPELDKTVAEALQVADELGNPDLRFEARLLEAKTHTVLGQTDLARKIFLELLEDGITPDHEAAVCYELFRIDPGDNYSRKKALDLYRTLYRQTPRYLFKMRLEILEKLSV